MSREAHEEDAIRYVLGEMTPEEERAFVELLDKDPELAEYTREIADALGAVAKSLPEATPHPELRDKILSAVENSTKPRTSLAWLPITLAACFALLAIFGWIQKLDSDRIVQQLQRDYVEMREESQEFVNEIDALEADRQKLTKELDSAKAQARQLTIQNAQLQTDLEEAKAAASFNNLKLAALESDPEQDYEASLAWDGAQQQGVLEVANLPANEAGKAYQLWIIEENNPNPVSAGVFQMSEAGAERVRFQPVKQVGTAIAFAISIEQEEGVPAPQGPIILKYGL